MNYKKIDDYYLLYVHDSKNIPIDGWLHNCIFCSTITHNELKYDSDFPIKIIICNNCKKNNNIKNYNHKIDNWIKKNIIKFPLIK